MYATLITVEYIDKYSNDMVNGVKTFTFANSYADAAKVVAETYGDENIVSLEIRQFPMENLIELDGDAYVAMNKLLNW